MESMEVTKLKGNGKIVTARTEIYVPHLDEVLAFSLPTVGPSHFNRVMAAIDEDKGLRPTTAQTFSLVNLALQNPDEEHCKDILGKFRDNYFWTSTENLWDKEDVIVYDNVDGKMPSDRESLIKRYKDGDKAVRIVPYGFQKETQSVEELLKNPYVIAQVGNKDMIDVVKKVAEGISKNKPYVWALNTPQKDVKRYTALYSDWGDGRLGLGGSCNDDGRNGYASRVRNASTEGAKNFSEAYTPDQIIKTLKILHLSGLEEQILNELKK